MIAPVSPRRLPARPADRVGVVLLAAGGPNREEAVAAFVQQRLCDLRRVRFPWLPDRLCRAVARLVARRRAASVAESLALVGGAVPETRLLVELAEQVEETLASVYPHAAWTVVPASRYGTPSLAEAADRLRNDGVDRIVAVPLVSVWTEALSGTLARAWTDAATGLKNVPTAWVRGFADRDGYADALAERIAEAMQRFPRAVRRDVHVLFAVHPDGQPGGDVAASPFQPVVGRVAERLTCPTHVAFAPVWGGGRTASPAVADVVAQLVREGVRHLVVVPIGFVVDTMDTVCELDLAQRRDAEALGAIQYEVAAALNLHEAFVGTLAAVASDALGLPAPAADIAHAA